ncbi:hypothetical protein EJB05_32571 [Eragrostis curvula]|uniref:Uncharacterized protein n=1 Tax=Eragrostis curvula TaxID=38414 RepID=A0A5J9UHX1_9POAL|nr:hypothetical protein EJB05_32571 [Eragrostis curvula]
MVQEQSSSGQPHPLPKYGAASPATGVARASKKIKPKKIPQRGLGVAQLEKLRIEEQKKMDGGAAVLSPVAHPRALTGGGLGHLLPLHPPPPVPLSALTRPAADGGGFWDPAADPAMKHPYKRSLCPQPPLPMVSTGLSLTASSSHHQTEPPSNQMYSSSGSRSSAAPADEDRESAGMLDRSWPFMFEGMTAATFRTTGKAAPTTAPFAARMARETGFADVCPDLSRHEFRTTNYFSTNANYSDWSSDFAHCKNSKANVCTGEPAFLTLSAQPATLMKQPHHLIPSVHLQEYSDFGIMQSQASEKSHTYHLLKPATFNLLL